MATIKKAQYGSKTPSSPKKFLGARNVQPKDSARIEAGIESRTPTGIRKGPAKGKMGMKIKKAQVGTTVKKIANTKLKDVPQKVKNVGTKMMNKAKNATVGDMADIMSMGGYSSAKELYRMSKGTPSKYLKDQIKQRNGGSTRRMQAGGVAGKSPKAGMVDPRGAYTKVQMRTLGNMKMGGKMSKRK